MNRSSIYHYVLPGFVLILALFLRSYDITNLGLSGSDTAYYVSLAHLWVDHHFVFQVADRLAAYRPVLLAIYAFALKLLGSNDWSIKVFNLLADCFTLCLIMILSYRGSGKQWIAAIFSGLIYATLPIAIWLSRLELPHTLSTLFVTLGVFCYLLSEKDRQSKRYLWLFLTGVFTGMAVGTHEELGLLAIGYGLYLVYYRFSVLKKYQQTSNGRVAWKDYLIDIATFAAGFLLVASFSILLHGLSIEKVPVVKHINNGVAPFSEIIDKVFRFYWTSLYGVSSSFTAAIISLIGCLSIGLFIYRRCNGRPADRIETFYFLPFLLVLIHIIMFASVFPRMFVRNFLPLFPVLLVGTSALLFRSIGALPNKERALIFKTTLFVALIPIVLSHFSSFRNISDTMRFAHSQRWSQDFLLTQESISLGFDSFKQRVYRRSWYATIHNLLKDRVDDKNRLLVTPSIKYPYPGRRILQSSFYFGDHASYMIDYESPLRELINTRHIRYVLFSTYRSNKKFLKEDSFPRYRYGNVWEVGQPSAVGKTVGLNKETFTLQHEYVNIKNILDEMQARIWKATGVYSQNENSSIGRKRDYVIYELPRQ